jgi:PAS domain S-box-containing protein
MQISSQALRWLAFAIFLISATGLLAFLLGSSKAANKLLKLRQEVDVWEQTAAYFITLVQNSPDIFSRFDRELRHTYVSPVITTYTGLPAEHFLGKTNEKLSMPAALCKEWRATMEQSIATKIAGNIDFSFRIPAGALRHFHARIIPEIKGTEVTSLLCITTDITERKETAEALRISEEKLRLASQAKDEFLAVLVHELRNPLGAIRGAVELQSKLNNSAAWQRAAAIILRQTNQMKTLVEDLLDIARISNGKMDMQLHPADVRGLITHALENCAALINPDRHQIEIDLPDHPLLVNCDTNRLVQVFSNLINNAVKYSPSGGKIAIKATGGSTQNTIVVSDTGIGIDPVLLDYIFDMFSQIGVARSHCCGGLGIGLALVRKLVDIHGGTVTAYSNGINTGSTFTITLPAL